MVHSIVMALLEHVGHQSHPRHELGRELDELEREQREADREVLPAAVQLDGRPPLVLEADLVEGERR